MSIALVRIENCYWRCNHEGVDGLRRQSTGVHLCEAECDSVEMGRQSGLVGTNLQAEHGAQLELNGHRR